jgi:hypothetical protein
MKRQVKAPEKHDNVTPEIAKKAVASVMYKGPKRRLMMADESGFSRSEPTLSDIKAYLSEHGLVAVPLEPTEAMTCAGLDCGPSADYDEVYKAMIAARGEGE